MAEGESGKDVIPFDIHRMLLGDLPWTFTLEVVVRTVIMYAFAVGLVRTLSRRAVGQLSLMEFMLVVALGSAVGDPMFYADVPLVHCMIVVAVVVTMNHFTLYFINRHEPVETLLEGKPSELIRDGRLDHNEIIKASLSNEKLFALLREHSIRHLGEIEHVFLEQDGKLTIYTQRPGRQRAGLEVFPPWDLEPPRSWKAGCKAEYDGLHGCSCCGEILRFSAGDVLPPCPRCQNDDWVDRVCEAENDGDDKGEEGSARPSGGRKGGQGGRHGS